MTEPVVCLGECLVDRLLAVGETPSDHWVDYPGGAPANVAAAIAKLGTPSRLVSCLGNDELGDWLVQGLEEQGVHCQIQRVQEVPTRTVLVQRDATGDRQFIGFSGPDPAGFADAYLSPEWVEQVDFSGVQFLIMGTLGLAYPTTASAMQRAVDKARQAGTKIVIDLNWRPVFWPEVELAPAEIREFLNNADLLKLSREEALWLLETDSAPEVQQVFPHCQVVLLTDGANGSTWATDEHSIFLPAFVVASQDTTGAGDAFLAGVIHQLCQRGWNSLLQPDMIEAILRYASGVGALTTLHPGAIAAQPTPAAVDAFLLNHGVALQ